MFEDMTYDEIMFRLLSNVSNDVDKREGSIIYDALAPAAMELYNLYIAADQILSETFADTASREYLILRANERGLVPYNASYAVMKGIASPSDCEISVGDRFSLNGYYYTVTGSFLGSDGVVDEGTYLMKASASGNEPGNQIGNAIPVNYINGLESMVITDCISAGEDEESTEHFRQRYFNSLISLASGGNVAWYKQIVNDIDGVGACKVYRAKAGNNQIGGNVTLRILDSNFNVPDDDTLRNNVKAEIDPPEESGEGLGLAPIGHQVTVLYPNKQAINIDITAEYSDGYDWLSVKDNVETVIENYLQGLRTSWADTDTTVVRKSRIENAILNDVSGITDIFSLKLNGESQNIILNDVTVPVRGDINDNSI